MTTIVTVLVGGPICRRCVRRASRHVSDVPGVVSLEVRADRGLLRVRGALCPAAVAAALRLGGYPVLDVRDG
ncbi:hypothetical protein [Dactylosporangium sp. NPDC048998]|uniref:hypothetical protein n=1 Tax=Dactylosporangium sp. NPDC048998 TaxID=3363976 RepID=UPI0037142D2C